MKGWLIPLTLGAGTRIGGQSYRRLTLAHTRMGYLTTGEVPHLLVPRLMLKVANVLRETF